MVLYVYTAYMVWFYALSCIGQIKVKRLKWVVHVNRMDDSLRAVNVSHSPTQAVKENRGIDTVERDTKEPQISHWPFTKRNRITWASVKGNLNSSSFVFLNLTNLIRLNSLHFLKDVFLGGNLGTQVNKISGDLECYSYRKWLTVPRCCSFFLQDSLYLVLSPLTMRPIELVTLSVSKNYAAAIVLPVTPISSAYILESDWIYCYWRLTK